MLTAVGFELNPMDYESNDLLPELIRHCLQVCLNTPIGVFPK